jgi:Glycosyltransferase family 10 (fucosyltransferase) C-term
MTRESEDLALLTVSVKNQVIESRIVSRDLPAPPNEHRTVAPRRKHVGYLVGLLLLTNILSLSGWLRRRGFIRTPLPATTKAKIETAPLSGVANVSRLQRDDESEVGRPSNQFVELKPKRLNIHEANETIRTSSGGGGGDGDRGSFDHGLNRRIPKRSPHHAYQCGYYPTTTFLNAVFPETNATMLEPELLEETPLDQLFQSFQSDDVLLLTCGGRCFVARDRLFSTFPGPILNINGESTRGRCPIFIPPSMKERVTSITRVGSDLDRWNESTFSVAILVAADPSPSVRMQLYRPEMRPRGTGKHFLMYANSHCVPHREEAFRRLAAIGPEVHYTGKCNGGGGVGRRVNDTRKRQGFRTNANLYHNYRFTLAMENAAVPGYITEKIMMPFLAGSVPIYYGTAEVFDVFNRNAFVWYDVNDPQPALDQIKYLEANRTAYAATLRQPILANGEETIAKYFSIRDEDGGGRLKWAIRDRIGFG